MRARVVLVGSVAVAAIGCVLNGCSRSLVSGDPGSGASGGGGAAGGRGGNTAGSGGSVGATLELLGCVRDLLGPCPPQGWCVEVASGPNASNVCFETGVRASLGYMDGSGSCPHGDLYVHVPKADGKLCYRYEAYTATSTACEVTRHTWKDPAGNIVALGTSTSSPDGRSTEITCTASGATASCSEPGSVPLEGSCCGVSRFGTAACTAGVPNALCMSTGSCPGAGGTGGSGRGGTGGGTTGFGEPACASTVFDGSQCGPADQQLCYKRCGPERVGVKAYTCQASQLYAEMSGCAFDPAAEYSCYWIPTVANVACPAGVTPVAAMDCGTVPPCVTCNSMGGVPGGMYIDSTGAPKTGYCTCQPPNAAGVRTWSCAVDTNWPCPVGSGC